MITVSYVNNCLSISGHALGRNINPLCVAVSCLAEMVEAGINKVLGIKFAKAKFEGEYRFCLTNCWDDPGVALLIDSFFEVLIILRGKYPEQIKLSKEE